MTTAITLPQNKAQKISIRVLSILMFTWMLALGITKLIGTEPHLVDTFTKMNMLSIMKPAGFLEILGGLGLLFPKYRTYAALCLLPMFIGAFAAHFASQTMLPMGPHEYSGNNAYTLHS